MPGSGIYLDCEGGGLWLVGIHEHVQEGLGFGCYLTEQKRNLINGWINKEIITIDLGNFHNKIASQKIG